MEYFNSQEELRTYLQAKEKLKIGLALAGGGTKGFAHIGAIKAFEEIGLTFNFIAGTSVGSMIGAVLAAGFKADEIFKIAGGLKEKDITLHPIPFLNMTTKGVENIITSTLGEEATIEDLNIPFAAVTTCLNDGEEVVFRKGRLVKAVSASCAVPGVFKPVSINGKNYVDGGVVNNLPINVVAEEDCDVIIAVDIMKRDVGTDSTNVFEVLSATINILMTRIRKGDDADILIEPNLTKFKEYKLKGNKEMYDEGYNEAKKSLRKIIDVILEKGKAKN